MEDAFRDLWNIVDSINHFLENGPRSTKIITPEDIGYVSGLCILAFFGTLGNILILIMFSKREFSKTSYSIYIRAAAISDTIFMLMNISEDIMDHVTSYPVDKFQGTSYGFCIFWNVTKGTFRTASPWIVVALALDRCVAVWNPLSRTGYCSKKTAAIVTAGIVLGALSVELGLALSFTKMMLGEMLYTVCAIVDLSDNFLIIKRLVTETGLPCITMLIPNILVIFKIQQSHKFRRSFSTENDQRGKVAKSARPLLVVSCLAFITLLPISITEMVELSKMNQEVAEYDDHYDNLHHHDFLNELNRNNISDGIFDDRVFNSPNIIDDMISNNSTAGSDENVNSKPAEITDLGTEERSMIPDSIENAESDANVAKDGLHDGVNDDDTDKMEETWEDIQQRGQHLEHETDDGLHDGMNEDDMEKMDERGEDQEPRGQHLEHETDDGLHDGMNEHDMEKMDERWEDQEPRGQHLEHETEDGPHDGMKEDDMEKMDERWEDQQLRHETEDGEYPDTEEEGEDGDDSEYDQKLLDVIWKTCNFIYMCNFSQNFYLLMLSSKRYRASLFKMFYCRQNKKYKAESQVPTETVSSSIDR